MASKEDEEEGLEERRMSEEVGGYAGKEYGRRGRKDESKEETVKQWMIEVEG